MLKQFVSIEVTKGEKIYQLHLPHNAELGEIHDVLHQMRTFIVNRINEEIKKEEPQTQNESSIQE